MKKYSVLIKGKNLRFNIDGETCMHGFFTTRYVEAYNKREAKGISLNLIKKELRSSISNDSVNPPKFLFEDVSEIDDFEGCEAPGAGFTFFEEN